MVWVTLPFILFAFIFYSAVCFIESFIEKERPMAKNKNSIIDINKYRTYDKRIISRKNFVDFEKSSVC